jgi:hypothetical protein
MMKNKLFGTPSEQSQSDGDGSSASGKTPLICISKLTTGVSIDPVVDEY